MITDITQKIYDSIGGEEFFASINLIELNSLGNSIYFNFDSGNKVNHCSIYPQRDNSYGLTFHKMHSLLRSNHVSTYSGISADRLNEVFRRAL